MSGVSFSGIAINAACPARSRLARTRTRPDADGQSPCRCAMMTGPQSSLIIPSRHGMRSRKNSSWLCRRVVSETSSPAPSCCRQSSRCDRQTRQASRGGYCTVRQSRQTCSYKRPRAAAAVSPSATRLRPPGGSVGTRVRRIGFLRGGRTSGRVIVSLPRCKDGGAAAQPAIVIDHTEAARQTKPRLGHDGAKWLTGDLSDDFYQTEKTAGRPGLADRQLSARRVEGKRAVRGETVSANEVRAFAFLAEAKILDLHDVDDRVVVVGGNHIDVRRADFGLRIHFVGIERPAAAILNWIVGIGVVPLDGR